LTVYESGSFMPPAARDFIGDALWAAMIVWWISAALPSMPTARRAVASLAFCYAIECSQLVHFSALDALRATAAGHLVLGSGFDWRDFGSYAIGVLAAAGVECVLFKKRFRDANRGGA
jgi:hypothetical protein